MPNFIHKKIGINLDENEFLTFSLHATKLISAGEGGVLIGKDKKSVKEIKKMINFGLDNERKFIYKKGLNAKLSEFNCILGYESLNSFYKNRNKYYDIKNKFRNDLMKHGFSFFNEKANISLTENLKFENIKFANKILKINGRRWWKCIDQSKKKSFKYWQETIGIPYNAKKNISKQVNKALSF